MTTATTSGPQQAKKQQVLSNPVLATAASKTSTDKLQRVLNAAVRVVSSSRKFDHGLSRLMHQDLHWLNIPELVRYKLCMLIADPPMSTWKGA